MTEGHERGRPQDGQSGAADRSEVSTDRSAEELVAQVDRLRGENRRLKREYAAARRSRYRRTALGLYAVGAVAVLAALALPDVGEVLFALGATGLFAGVLTYYLAPERFVSGRVGAHVASAGSATLAALIADLGLAESRVYLPREDATAESDTLLFVPQTTRYEVPDAPTPGVSVGDDDRSRGLVVVPTGGPLVRELERGLDDGLAAEPGRLAEQVAEGVEQFELVSQAQTEVVPATTDDHASDGDAGRTRLTLRCTDPAFGPPTRVDHPVASLVAAATARARGAAVELRVDQTPAESDEYLVTVAWDRPAA